MSRRYIMLTDDPRPPTPPRVHIPGRVPQYIMPGFCHTNDDLEPHINFHFQRRLNQELDLRNPEQPYFGDPLPQELEEASASPAASGASEQPHFGDPLPQDEEASASPAASGASVTAARESAITSLTYRKADGYKVRVLSAARRRTREQAKRAAERENRFRKVQAHHLGLRTSIPRVSSRSINRVAKGAAINPSCIENRDYEFGEVVGPDSRFNFRFIPWGAYTSRAVYARDKSLVLLLGGRPRNKEWIREVVEPATTECKTALSSFYHPAAERDTDVSLTLTGGIGASFNEPKTPAPPYGKVLNALVFFQLFSTLAMKRLLGYGNRLLEVYCPVAFLALQAQKAAFLERNAEALYPSDCSVYSAATFELGGPHYQTTPTGQPDRQQAGTWNTLTALGHYSHFHGGHIIVWDLGLVISFPAGATILIPAGVVRYSFVKVRLGEHRYSVLQWAGGGISRYMANGGLSDVSFAVHSSREQHETRETNRRYAHEHALDVFPIEGDLAEEAIHAKFIGTDPTLISYD